jgi:hypothetical protein
VDYFGGDSRRLQCDWRPEAPVALARFGQAMRQSPRRAEAKGRVFLAHSKGYKIARGLKSLRDNYDYAKDDGTFPRRFYRIFPGLNRILREDVGWAMRGLLHAKFAGLGGPVEGIENGFLENSLIGLVNAGLLSDIGASFDPELVAAYHEALEAGPEDLDLLITSQLLQNGPGAAAIVSTSQSLLERVSNRAANTLFNGIGHLYHRGRSDGLVVQYARGYHNHRVLRGRYNHLEQVESPRAAVDIIGTFLDHGI